MKLLKSIFFVFAFLSMTVLAQEKEPKLIQFNNFQADFEVPAGKTWVINSIFSNSIGEIAKNVDGTTSTLPIRIFIKSMNGDIKTDWEGNRFGPQVYQSDNNSATIPYPITLPEKTKFSLVIVIGNPGNMKAYHGSGYISFFEVTNNDF